MSYVQNEHFKIMLKNKEKNSVVRVIFLIGGWGLGLIDFTREIKKGVSYQLLDGVLHFLLSFT